MGTCCFEVISVWVQIAFIEMVQFIKLLHYWPFTIFSFQFAQEVISLHIKNTW